MCPLGLAGWKSPGWNHPISETHPVPRNGSLERLAIFVWNIWLSCQARCLISKSMCTVLSGCRKMRKTCLGPQFATGFIHLSLILLSSAFQRPLLPCAREKCMLILWWWWHKPITQKSAYFFLDIYFCIVKMYSIKFPILTILKCTVQ